ncbi:uncharacterized protein Dwil_GK14326 [Drosophila willistoni]|uniref:CHK kinase-like domain-containing protein n=1 Tax=Drosophila willistoni TaxID=7260 RepID=A0A0Q9WWI7_DROWI|nr:uncharacterized protein Dwil_GK14326 [Drosophila willistoni]
MPKCDYLLMEDLVANGYKNMDRTVGLDQRQMEAVLRKLAQWHAASVVRVSQIGHYEDSNNDDKESVESEPDDSFQKNCVAFLDCLPLYDLDPPEEILITNYVNDIFKNWPTIPDEILVLNHGDLWCNNIMFKVKEESNEILDVCFVDYQMTHYGTPANDLFCLLMTSPQLDETKKDVNYILKIPLVNDRGDDHEFHDLFVSELDMYDRLVPELESIYAKNTSLLVKFKPLHYKFTDKEMLPKCDYLLMEDLRAGGYKNVDRTVGLNQREMEAVLKKLAQWHSASAVRVSQLGDYEEAYKVSYFSEEHIKFIDGMNISFCVPFLECMQQAYGLDPGEQILIQLQQNLFENSLWAFLCAQRMLPIVLLPADVDSHIGNFMGETEEAVAFKRKTFLSPAYVEQIKLILPWLIARSYIR